MSLVFLAAVLGAEPVCSAPVAAGDRVAVWFTCRHQDGKGAVAVTNREQDAEVSARSPFFQEPERYEPWVLEAGADTNPVAPVFEGEVLGRLRPHLAGMEVGASREVTLRAGAAPVALHGGETSKTLSRDIKVPFHARIPLSRYKNPPGGVPEPGTRIHRYPGFVGIVGVPTRGAKKELVIRFKEETPGAPIQTSMGPLSAPRPLREERQFLVRREAEVGQLVRLRGLVGRVSARDEETITFDFGDAFGGETLHCVVIVEEVETTKTRAAAADTTSEPDPAPQGDPNGG